GRRGWRCETRRSQATCISFPVEPLPDLFACPNVVFAPGIPNRLTPRPGALRVLFGSRRLQDGNNGQLTSGGGRLQKWKVPETVFASLVEGATSCPDLADAGVAT